MRRTLTVLPPAVRLAYVRLAAVAAPTVEEALSGRVMANRVLSSCPEPPALTLRPWRLERRLFARALDTFASAHDAVAIADVATCYASIRPHLAHAALERIGAPQGPAVERFLAYLAREGVRGLPVGPDPSAVFANAVLAHADRALEAEGIAHLRWVDDFVIGGDGPGSVAHGLDVLRDALARLGLCANEGKTRIVEDPSVLARAMPSSLRGSARRVG